MTDVGGPPPGWELDREEGVAALLGTVFKRVVDGRAEAGFLPEPRHLNKHGVVHGGCLLAFLDHALGLGSRRADGRGRVTMQLNAQFVARVNAGDLVTAEVEVVRETGAFQFVRAVCRVGDAPVLVADGVWKAVTARRTPASPSP